MSSSERAAPCDVDAIEALLAGLSVVADEPSGPRLRDYQASMIADIKQAWHGAGARSVLAYLPTGGGKTIVAASLAKESVEGRVLFIVNRNTLLEQTSATLERVGVPRDHVGVFGGGAPKPHADDSTRPIVIASIQSLTRDATWLSDGFRLVIIDECHCAFANSYVTLLQRLGVFAPADAPPATACRCLGITATPFRSVADERLERVFDAAVWGPSITQLIARGVLVPPLVFGPSAAARHDIRNDDEAALDRVVARWRARCGGARTLAFAASVAQSKALSARFVAAGVRAMHLDGTTPARERARAFAALRAGASAPGDEGCEVLCSRDVLAEGFDEPRVGALILLRRTESRGLYIQQIGRGLRAADMREEARKLECVILDEAGNTHRHGSVTGPLGYVWECARGEARAPPASRLRRCGVDGCDALFHSSAEKCPACGRALVTSNPSVCATRAALPASNEPGRQSSAPSRVPLRAIPKKQQQQQRQNSAEEGRKDAVALGRTAPVALPPAQTCAPMLALRALKQSMPGEMWRRLSAAEKDQLMKSKLQDHTHGDAAAARGGDDRPTDKENGARAALGASA